jgi:hypothetical protein
MPTPSLLELTAGRGCHVIDSKIRPAEGRPGGFFSEQKVNQQVDLGMAVVRAAEEMYLLGSKSCHEATPHSFSSPW